MVSELFAISRSQASLCSASMAKHETTPIGDIPDEIVAQRSMKNKLGFIGESVPKSPPEDRKLNTEARSGKLESVLKSRNKELSDKIEMLIREKNDVFSAKENEIYWLRDELLTLTNQCGERGERIHGLLSEIKTLKDFLELASVGQNKVNERLDSIMEETGKIRVAILSVLEAKNEALDREKNKDKVIESLKSVVSEKEKALESLKSTVSEKEKTIKDMKKKLRDLAKKARRRAR